MKSRAGWSLLVVLLLTPVGAFGDGVDAKRSAALNRQGYREYRKGNHDRALALFEEAIQQNGENALAHYNSACVLAVLRKKGHVCEAPFGVVLQTLSRAVALDPSLRKRALVDPDLKELRATALFQLLRGHSADTDEGIRKLLPHVHWDSSQHHADATLGGSLEFNRDGTLAMKPPNKGRYRVEDRRVILELEYGKPVKLRRTEIYVFELGGTSATLRPAEGQEGLLPYADAPDECNL